MKTALVIILFLTAVPSFAYTCIASAEFCQSSEKVMIYTEDLRTACDELYRKSAADQIVEVICINENGESALKLDRCN